MRSYRGFSRGQAVTTLLLSNLTNSSRHVSDITTSNQTGTEASKNTTPSNAPAATATTPKPIGGSTIARLRTSEEIVHEESRSQHEQVDPFRIGYNMGMQNVHLESLRTKLDDNLELLKSHFNSLRESLKLHQDNMRSLQSEYTKQSKTQFDDGMMKLSDSVDQLGMRLQVNEDNIRELTRQQLESLQKHMDDRLENLKDTVKVAVAFLMFFTLWTLLMVNQQQQQLQHVLNAQRNAVQASAQMQHSPTSWVTVSHDASASKSASAAAKAVPIEEKKGFWSKIF